MAMSTLGRYGQGIEIRTQELNRHLVRRCPPLAGSSGPTSNSRRHTGRDQVPAGHEAR